MAELSKNPLSVVFGLLLGKWRRDYTEKYGEYPLADRLKLQSTYLNRVENGYAMIHTKHTHRLKQAIDTLHDVDVNFQKLVTYMACIQVINENLKISSIESELDALSLLDQDLTRFIDKLKNSLVYFKGSTDEATYNSLVLLLEKYLCTYNTKEAEQLNNMIDGSIEEQLSYLPSYISPFIYRNTYDTIHSVLRYVPSTSISLKDAQNFEKEHITQIESMIFLLKEEEFKKLYVEEVKLKGESYDFPALSYDNFKTYTFLIVGDIGKIKKLVVKSFHYKMDSTDSKKKIFIDSKQPTTFLEKLALQKYPNSIIADSKIRNELKKFRFTVIEETDDLLKEINASATWLWMYQLNNNDKYSPFNNIVAIHNREEDDNAKAKFLTSSESFKISSSLHSILKQKKTFILKEESDTSKYILDPKNEI